ncbi:MAG: type VI secretion system baseplate subunit TssE [Polyangiales bacterium]
MPESPKEARLRPSLLERLTDREPGRAREPREARAVDEESLKEQVRRDVSWLFNTTHLEATHALDAYPEVARSVVNFGIPALTGRTLGGVDVEALQRDVLTALTRFEPRLAPESLEIEVLPAREQFAGNALIIDVRGVLYAEPLPLALYLRTEVDLESGRIAVAERREGGG